MYDAAKPSHLSPAHRLPVLAPTEAEVTEAMRAIVSYNWEDEMADFNDNPHTDHPYLQLRILHAHLYRPTR